MIKFCSSWLRTFLIPCLVLFASFTARGETNPKFYAVEVSATVYAAPAQVHLRWAADPNATGYTIYKKAPAATAWTQLANLAGSANTWSDANVASGSSYEYAITKSTTLGYKGTGYALVGINAPMTENRGKMILIVDNTHAAALATELTRLQQDLVGDGWTVVRHDVARSTTAPQVKALIKNAYSADPNNVKSVFLFGHVAVPYSGNGAVDGHPDHKGAWVADTYYGDMDGTWTDTTVNNASAEKAWNHNVPGDGKFDQTELPSDVELAVGRVDLYNMTCYANKSWSRSELDLLRAYLNKDHNFRHGRIVVPRRGLICDNFGESGGEAFASTGWRSFAPFFGAEYNVQVNYGQYFSTLRDNGYLWSYGTGGGSWYTCNGVGSSDDFANTEIKTVFTAFLGSYFGDWDNESAFLRAPLGSGYALATAWGGRPHWFFHPMGLGEPIGVAAKLSQNNRFGGLYAGQNYGTRYAHVTLLGDPSLRMHPVIPPASVAFNGSTVTWAASTDTAIQGYNVYRATSANGPFTKINGNAPVSNLFFNDPSPVAGAVYMVRAIKLEQSGSGTYLNLSQGTFSSALVSNPNPTPTPNPTPQPQPTATVPKAPSNLTGAAISATEVRLQWNDNSTNETGFEVVLRKQGVNSLATTFMRTANSTNFISNGLAAGTQYLFKVRAFNNIGVAESPEISVTTPQVSSPPASTNTAANVVRFVALNTTSGGTWKGFFGSDGVHLAAQYLLLPNYANVTFAGKTDHVWNWSNNDPAALQKSVGTDRVASCWYAGNSFDLRVNITDGKAHKIGLYALDWDMANRAQRVDVLDAATGKVLHTTNLSSFQRGAWLSYDVKGSVIFRVTRTAGPNAVISGLFFDSPSAVF